MDIDRRRLLALSAATLGASAGSSAMAAPAAPPVSALGLDAGQFGLRPGSADDQSRALQRALDEAARTRAPLAIAPGVYRVGGVKLPAGAQLIGVRGATRLVLANGPSLLAAAGADQVTLSGLVLDGGRRPLPERRGLVQFENCASLKIADCEIKDAGGNGIVLVASGGEITATTIIGAGDVALHSLDARGLVLARNTINGAGNNGIQVWRSAERRRRHHRGRQSDREHRQPLRRLGAVRQRHQRVSRRQRDRARQPHRQLRVLGGARQRRLQHPHRRQQRERRARGRALFGIRLRGRADRQQHGRRRRDRHLGHQFQRGRTAGGRAGQHHPQPDPDQAGRAPIRAIPAASASRSRPTPR